MIYPVSDEERLLFWIRVGCSYHFFRDVLVRSNQVWCQEGFCNPAVGKKPIEWQDGSGINPAGGRQLLTTDHAFTAAQPPRGGSFNIQLFGSLAKLDNVLSATENFSRRLCYDLYYLHVALSWFMSDRLWPCRNRRMNEHFFRVWQAVMVRIKTCNKERDFSLIQAEKPRLEMK